jgi:hypothetical protein
MFIGVSAYLLLQFIIADKIQAKTRISTGFVVVIKLWYDSVFHYIEVVVGIGF